MFNLSKTLKISLVGATLAVAFTGCAGMNNPLPPKQMQSQSSGTIEMSYKFSDDINDQQLTANDMIRSITSHMSGNSVYKNKNKYRNSSGSFRYIYGKTVSYSNNNIVINYVNGDDNCGNCENGESITKVFFELPTTIQETSKNNFNLKSSFPNQYTVRAHTDALGIEHSTLDTPAKLESDAKKMFDSLKSKPITIERKVEFKGEVNTKYPDKAVYANFKRLMGNYSWRSNENVSEIKKQNSFNLKVANTSYPLHVEVYPYREGSKVTYTTTLSYNIDSQGNATLKSSDIQELHKKIEKIVND